MTRWLSAGGNDKINAAQGDDELTGGGGADKFKCGSGDDTVTDFNEEEDKASGNCEIHRINTKTHYPFPLLFDWTSVEFHMVPTEPDLNSTITSNIRICH